MEFLSDRILDVLHEINENDKGQQETPISNHNRRQVRALVNRGLVEIVEHQRGDYWNASWVELTAKTTQAGRERCLFEDRKPRII